MLKKLTHYSPAISGEDAKAFLEALHAPPTDAQQEMAKDVKRIIEQRKSAAARKIDKLLVEWHVNRTIVNTQKLSEAIVEQLWNFR